MSTIMIMNVADIRYTQDTINDTFSDGSPIGQTVHMLKTNKIKATQIPKITVFYHNGWYRSLDNRRLYCFKSSHITRIPVKVKVKSKMPYEFRIKNSSQNNGKSVRVRSSAKPKRTSATGNTEKWVVKPVIAKAKKIKVTKKVKLYHCKVCGIRKMDASANEAHLNGQRHKKKLKNQSIVLRKNQAMVKPKPKPTQTIDGLEKELRSKKDELIKQVITKKVKLYDCKVCGIRKMNAYDNKAHLNGQRHKKHQAIVLRNNMEFLADNGYIFSLYELPDIYREWFKMNIESVFNGKLEQLAMHFKDLFRIEHDNINSRLYLVSLKYKPINANQEDIFRKNMECIAYNNSRVSLDALPDMYIAYFKADIKNVFRGRLVQLAIYLKDLFVIQEDYSQLYLVSKIYKPTQIMVPNVSIKELNELNGLRLKCNRLEKQNQQLTNENMQIKIMKKKIDGLEKELSSKEDELIKQDIGRSQDNDYKLKVSIIGCVSIMCLLYVMYSSYK